MKRSEIKRKTPLQPGKGLSRSVAWGPSERAASTLHRNQADRAHRTPKRRTARNTGPTAKVIALVWRRDEGRCVRCGNACDFAGRGTAWSPQHRRARGMGGTRRPDTNQPQNLIVLCGSATTECHGWVESRREAALSNGWAVKSNSDPLQVPVLHWRDGLIYLLEDGSVIPADKPEEATA